MSSVSGSLLKGILVAPIASIFGGLSWFLVLFSLDSSMLAKDGSLWESAVAFSVLLMAISYIVVAFLAVPLHLLLVKLEKARLQNYIYGGLTIGLIIAFGFRPISVELVGLTLWCALLVSALFGYLTIGRQK